MKELEKMKKDDLEKLIKNNMDLFEETVNGYQKELEEIRLSWQKEIPTELLLNPEFQSFLQKQNETYPEFQLSEDELQDCYLVFIESLIYYQKKERYLMRSNTKRNLLKKLKEIKIQQENKIETQRTEEYTYQTWVNKCQYINEKKEQQSKLQTIVAIFLETSNLSQRQQEIIKRIYGLYNMEPQSREILTSVFNCSKQTIDYEKYRALQKMKLRRNYLNYKSF